MSSHSKQDSASENQQTSNNARRGGIQPRQMRRGGARNMNGRFGQRSASPQSLDSTVQAKMEQSFQTDFSGVQVTPNSSEASAMGAQAFTQGDQVHFAPGMYSPGTEQGQSLIGHELTHVVQQKKGHVASTGSVNGQSVNTDSTLEQEADTLGMKASQGKSVQVQNATSGGAKQLKTKQDVVDSISAYDDYIKDASDTYGVSVNQIKAIIAVESAGQPEATSGAAFGLMQVTKSTWKYVQDSNSELKSYDFDSYWKNPKINILFGTAVFKGKMKTVGVSADNENFASLAITAYNAGEGTVKRAMQNAKDAGSKDPTVDCLKPEYLKPSIEHYGLYSYYLTGSGKKWNKTKTKEEAIQLKYNEISKYPGKVNDYLAILNASEQPTSETQTDNATSEPEPVKAPSSGTTYVVKSGETLTALAAKFETTIDELKAANQSKLKKWGAVEGFNAGEEITIPVKAKQQTRTEQLIEQYQKGEMDMIRLAQELIPMCIKAPKDVYKVFDILPAAHKDNLAYSISAQSDDGTLSKFSKSTALYLLSHLDLDKTSPANWIKYGKQSFRLGKIALGVVDKPEKEKEQTEKVAETEAPQKTAGEQRKELALEAVANEKDDRTYGWDFGRKAKGEKVDCSYFIREVEATANSPEARKLKQEKGFLTPAELNQYSTTFSAERFSDPDISKYGRGTQQMAAMLKKYAFYSSSLGDVKEGDYVFIGSGTSQAIDTISHIVVITKIDEADGQKRYWFADSGLSGAKKDKDTGLYEGGKRSVRNKFFLNHEGVVWGSYHFKGVGR